MILAALALAGLPLTSGFAAKNGLKYAAAATPEWWALSLEWVVPLTGITTTLLVCRFLYLIRPSPQASHAPVSLPMAVAWGVLTAGTVLVFVSLRAAEIIPAPWLSLAIVKMWAATWPLLGAGIIVLVLCVRPSWRARLSTIRIPAGDLAALITTVFGRCLQVWTNVVVVGSSATIRKLRGWLPHGLSRHLPHRLIRIEQRLAADLTAGFLVGLLVVVMFALMVCGKQ